MRVSDFKNKLDIKNIDWHQGVGLLHLANNIQDLDYDYIGFLHADHLPLRINNNVGVPPIPMQSGKLVDIKDMLNQFVGYDLMSFQTWPFSKFNNDDIVYGRSLVVNGQKLSSWQLSIKYFCKYDIYKSIYNCRLYCSSVFLAKKHFLYEYKNVIENIDKMKQPFITYVSGCLNKVGLQSYLLQAYSMLTFKQWQQKYRFKFFPICHFRNGTSWQ